MTRYYYIWREYTRAITRKSCTNFSTVRYNKRVSPEDPRWQHDFPGLAPESVHWLADKGCKIFGVEAVSPAPEGELNFIAHNLCGERGITHIEGLDNLESLLGRGRFRFIGFPLKLVGGSGSPIRAVAVYDK